MRTIIVTHMVRPGLKIEEIKESDGHGGVIYKPGKKDFTASMFETKEPDVTGFHNSIIIQLEKNQRENWQFFDARVMTHPNPKRKNCYVLTFDRVQRV